MADKTRNVRVIERSVLAAIFALFSILSTALLPFSPSDRAEAAESVKIGVLAKRGAEQCLKQWGPTADYLTENIDGVVFEIVPLGYDRISDAAERGEVDFVLANPANYVGIETEFGAHRIATLKNRCMGISCVAYGGVVFWRKDREDIRSFKDLKGKKFMAADEKSLGGWIAVWRELKENGVDPYRDFVKLAFAGDHDKVVYAVRDGLFDAGCVRTDILEQMTAEGKIDLSDFTVLKWASDDFPTFPFLRSTRLYPEWPMATLKGTSMEMAEKVAVALLQMPPDSTSAVAGNYSGWTNPQNYQPVHQLLRYLKLGPYRDLGKITLQDVFMNYGHWLVFAAVAITGFLVFTLLVLRMNDHIEESRLKLAAEVEERRKTDEALKEAKKVAEDAAKAKSEFLANMSHEIRTPMNGVIAAAELAMNEPLSPKVDNYLKIILSSAHSLLSLINDILDLSKIEAGKLSIESRPFMLDEIVDRVVDLFFNSASGKRIELLVNIEPDVPRALTGDPFRLQQILTNLVGNAVKFTEKGGHILIGASVSEIEDEKAKLTMWVKDTGIGISPGHLKNLFEPFTQGDASDTRRYEGTGLGLSICKRLVEMMDGRIWVESEQGKGTQFYFTAVFKRRRDEPQRFFMPPPDLKHLHVLVVDDCEENRVIIANYLESFGFTVEVAKGGKTALEMLDDRAGRGTAFDLVVLDWLMPQMDGMEVSRRIRDKYSPNPQIIMMTAFGSDIEKREAEKTGVQGFLIKPIYQSTLFNAIMDAFGKESYKKSRESAKITTDSGVYKKNLKGFRLLVVEDNPTNREIAVAILETAGIFADTAENGREAVEKLRKTCYDAILMDVQMPEMNGFQATRKIREDPSMAGLPIIAMTAHAMRGDKEKCMAAGMDGYVSKPVDQARLFQLLWRLLKNRRPVLESACATAEPEKETFFGGVGSLPDSIPGIEIREALENTKLASGLFLKILSGFRKNNLESVDFLKNAVEKGETGRIAQIAHALKGSGGNIGARDLQKAAAELEEAAGKRFFDSDPKQLAEKVEIALGVVLSSIRTLQEGIAAAPEIDPSRRAVDSKSLGDNLRELASALRRADPVEVARIAPVVKNGLDPVRYERIERLVEQYEYDEAVETVEKTISGLETGESEGTKN